LEPCRRSGFGLDPDHADATLAAAELLRAAGVRSRDLPL
jgi:hypothetical protein